MAERRPAPARGTASDQRAASDCPLPTRAVTGPSRYEHDQLRGQRPRRSACWNSASDSTPAAVDGQRRGRLGAPQRQRQRGGQRPSRQQRPARTARSRRLTAARSRRLDHGERTPSSAPVTAGARGPRRVRRDAARPAPARRPSRAAASHATIVAAGQTRPRPPARRSRRPPCEGRGRTRRPPGSDGEDGSAGVTTAGTGVP